MSPASDPASAAEQHPERDDGTTPSAASRILSRWRRFEALVGRLTLVLVLALATLLLADGVARSFASSELGGFRGPFGPTRSWKQPRPYIHHAGEPGATVLGGERHNRFGCRGPAPAPTKGSAEVRIFMVGGSTTYLGNPPAAALIEQRLRQNGGSDVRVFNFGVGASVSSMELVRIVTEIVDLEPDLVLMYGGGNDVIFPVIYDPRPGYPYDYPLYERNPLLEEDYDLLPLLAFKLWTVRRLADGYLREGFTGIEALRGKVKYDTPEWRERIARTYVRNLEKAHRICAAFGSRFLGVFQPTRQYTYEDMPDSRLAHCQEVRKRIRARIRRLDDEVRTDIVDLSNLFDGRPMAATYLEGDELHLTQEACELLAEALAAEIVAHFPELVGPRREPPV